jgi:DNA repair exonuclease SbcCD ATPase subunit
MSWLKGLAGKAEDFLNQIDQNAAVALQKERKELNSNEALLTEVTWDGQQSNKGIVTNISPRFSPPPTNGSNDGSVRTSPSLAGRSPVRAQKANSDDELIRFLNSSEPPVNRISEEKPARQLSEANGYGNAVSELREFSPIVVEQNDEQETQQRLLPTSRRSSPKEEVVEQSSVPIGGHVPVSSVEALQTENGLLKNELRSSNTELSLLLHRTKTAEKENCNLQQQLATLQANHKEVLHLLKEQEEQVARLKRELQDGREQAAAAQDLVKGLQLENARLLQDSVDSSGHLSQALQTLQDQIAEKHEELEAVQAVHHKELATVQDSLAILESERASLSSQLNQSKEATSELQLQCDRVRAELTCSRSELDQYRVRAQRILQDKERLIAELQGQAGSLGRSISADDTVELELDQLRQERDLLREEIVQVSARLKASRDELQEMERRLESGREQASQSLQLLQEERKKRQTAEEDCRTHAEELRAVRDELSRQVAQLASRVRERDAELSRLRSQLSQRPSSPMGDELENRLHTLTQTLVLKQSSLEAVTTEKNALRLQLEKIENKHRDTLALLHQMQSGLGSVNDTDDAKARVPSFLMESPFDTGVTRRVKRAYSSLDAVSIRTGVFLRRYPLARILVLCYMVLLHLWVMVVLFTYTPSGHV